MLTLQGLSKQKRIEREEKIATQAASVQQNYLLYPEVINIKLNNAALVQSRLQ